MLIARMSSRHFFETGMVSGLKYRSFGGHGRIFPKRASLREKRNAFDGAQTSVHNKSTMY